MRRRRATGILALCAAMVTGPVVARAEENPEFVIRTVAGNDVPTDTLANRGVHLTDLDTARGGGVLAADARNHQIYRIQRDGSHEVIAGTGLRGEPEDGALATSSPLSEPRSVTQTPNGDIWLVSNYSLWRIDASGRIHRLLSGGFSDGQLAPASATTVYTVEGADLFEVGHQGVVDVWGGGTDPISDGARKDDTNYHWTSALATGEDGTLFAGTRDGVVVRLGSDQVWRSVAGCPASADTCQGSSPHTTRLEGVSDLSIDGTDLVISSERSHQVHRLSGNQLNPLGSGQPAHLGDGPVGDVALQAPEGVTSTAGEIFVAHWGRLGRITGSQYTTIAGTGSPGAAGDGGPAVNSRLSLPTGIVPDSTGGAYVIDRYNNRVRHIDADRIITTFAGGAGLRCCDSEGAGDGGPAARAALGQPTAVATSPSGETYITDGSRIRVVGSDGVMSTLRTDRPIDQPSALAVDFSGQLLVLQRNGLVVRIGPDGAVTDAIWIELTGGIPGALMQAEDGMLYAASDSAVVRVSPDGSQTTVLRSSGTWLSMQVAWRPGSLFVSQPLENRVIELKDDGSIWLVAGGTGTGSSPDGTPSLDSRLQSPSGVAVVGSEIWMSEAGTMKIRSVPLDGPRRLITSASDRGRSEFIPMSTPLPDGTFGTPFTFRVMPANDSTESVSWSVEGPERYSSAAANQATVSTPGTYTLTHTGYRHGLADVTHRQTFVVSGESPPDGDPPPDPTVRLKVNVTLLAHEGRNDWARAWRTRFTCSEPCQIAYAIDGGSLSPVQGYEQWFYDEGDYEVRWIATSGSERVEGRFRIRIDLTLPEIRSVSPEGISVAQDETEMSVITTDPHPPGVTASGVESVWINFEDRRGIQAAVRCVLVSEGPDSWGAPCPVPAGPWDMRVFAQDRAGHTSLVFREVLIASGHLPLP